MPLVLNCRPLGVCFPVGETTNLRSPENMTDGRRREVSVQSVSECSSRPCHNACITSKLIANITRIHIGRQILCSTHIMCPLFSPQS